MTYKIENLSELNLKKIKEAFEVIPTTEISLDISNNNLGEIEAHNLKDLFKILSTQLVSYDLSQNNLERCANLDELIKLNKALPDDLKYLELADNELGSQKTETELALFFSSLPPNLMTLGLGLNKLGNLKGAGLARILKLLKVQNLDLCFNLWNLSGEELAEVLAALPPSVKNLSLKNNELGFKTVEELVKAFKSIPSTVKILDLSYNHGFCKKTALELAQIFMAIPATVETLDLSCLSLGVFSGEDLEIIFLALSNKNLKTLDLSHNRLEQVFLFDLAIPFAVISPSVETLILRYNDLHYKTPNELKRIFSCVPLSIKTYDLRGNKFNQEQLNAIFDMTIKWGVETIILDDKFIEGTKWFLKRLIDKVYRAIYFNSGNGLLAFDEIKFSVNIDDYRLIRWIEKLEQQNNPLADLTCGLLLANQIKTQPALSENCQFFDDYWEKRTHDAINFYLKAAREPSLKAVVKVLIIEFKTTCLFESVLKRMESFDSGFKSNKESLVNLGLFKTLDNSRNSTNQSTQLSP